MPQALLAMMRIMTGLNGRPGTGAQKEGGSPGGTGLKDSG